MMRQDRFTQQAQEDSAGWIPQLRRTRSRRFQPAGKRKGNAAGDLKVAPTGSFEAQST